MSKRITLAAASAVVTAGVILAWDRLPTWLGGMVIALLVSVLVYLLATPPVVPVADSRVPTIERLVAGQSARPWSPTMLPWPSSVQEKVILLIPAADYHLAEIVPLSRELETLGFATRVAVGESPWERTRPGLLHYPDLAVHQLPDPDSVARDAMAVVTMKDTGSMTEWVEEVRRRSVLVVGKVEGAQDFWDADTPDDRRPYRNLDLVLCQGPFDAQALADHKTEVVGSSRLERLWLAPPPAPPTDPLVLINLNFVYGVRTVDRKLWLDSAVMGCELAGIEYVISVHPAEKSRLGPHMTRISASAILPHASVLVSRFSTMPFEAMARGVPFVYHNPHGEAVRTFAEPEGAFDVTRSADELAASLRRAVTSHRLEERDRVRSWFLDHVSVDVTSRSEERSAAVIASLL